MTSNLFTNMASSLNSTCKIPVLMSTVKRRLCLLCRVAKKKPYLRLANKEKRFKCATEHRHWTEELCLEGQHPGVASSLLTLRLVFCGYYFIASLIRTKGFSNDQLEMSLFLKDKHIFGH